MTPKPFAKLDCGITESSIWTQPHDVLRVWIYLLAKCDEYGVVRASPVAIAHQCQVTVDRVSEILDILQSPDPYSRTEDHDGKRIMRTDGGWIVLNYALYRDNLLGKPLTAAERKRRQRAREATRDERMSRDVTKRDKCHDVSRNVIEAEAEAEAEADKEKNNPPSPPLGGAKVPYEEITELWNQVAAQAGVSPVRAWNESRRERARARWKDPYFREHWRAAIERMPNCPHLVGLNDRGWKANIDWFLRPRSVARVMEGAYGDSAGVHAGGNDDLGF